MSGLLILLGIFSIYYSDKMERNTARILSENVTSLKSAEELEIALLDIKGLTANYLIDGERKWLNTFSQKKDAFLIWFEVANNYTHTPEEEEILLSIQKLFRQYLKRQEKVVRYKQQGNPILAYRTLTDEMLQTFELTYNKCEELIFINEQLMNATSATIEKDNRTVNQVMYSIRILGILLGLTLGVLMARGITHSIDELVLKVKALPEAKLLKKSTSQMKTN